CRLRTHRGLKSSGRRERAPQRCSDALPFNLSASYNPVAHWPHQRRGRYWFRTSDLCRLNAFGVVQGVSGSRVSAGHVGSIVQLVPPRTPRDSAFITKSITKRAFALSLPSGPLPDARAHLMLEDQGVEKPPSSVPFVHALGRVGTCVCM